MTHATPDLDGIEARWALADEHGRDDDIEASHHDVPALVAYARTLLARAEKAEAKVAAMREALQFAKPRYAHNHDCGFFGYRANRESICDCTYAKIHARVDAALALDSAKEGSR